MKKTDKLFQFQIKAASLLARFRLLNVLPARIRLLVPRRHEVIFDLKPELDLPTMYYCNVIEREFHGCNYVPIQLFYGDKRSGLPYQRMIADFNTLTPAAQQHSRYCIDGMFLWNEVVELYELAAMAERTVLHYIKVQLPIISEYDPEHDGFGLPVFTTIDRGEGRLNVKEGLLNFSVKIDYDMLAFDISSRNHGKYQEMFEAGRAEYLNGGDPREDFWEDDKFRLN